MRFERLDLAPYGHFADRRLAFSPDAALHVVYGRNEAGKTTILEAIGDFLFGFPKDTAFGFAHDQRLLRVGGAFRLADGARLEARRRKGNKNTLVDDADRPVSDEPLRHALAGLDRDAFNAEFGLTAETLRSGGKALLKAGGKLAETLAAGSASLSVLNATQKRLRDEADDMFTPERRVSSKPLYQALDRHRAATSALKAAIVDSGEWRAAEAALEKARLREIELRDQLRTLREAVSRRKRAKRVRPKLAALTEAAALLAALGPVPEAPAATLAQAREALAADAAERAELERLGAEDAEAARALAGLVVDARVLAAKTGVEALGRQIGKVEDYESSLPRRIAEEADARLELDEIARKLGLAGADDVVARNPSNAELARARTLVAQVRSAQESRAKAAQALSQTQATIARLEAGRPDAAVDPATFKRRLEGFETALDAAKALAKERAAVAREGKELAERASALDPPVADLDALARAPLPDETALVRRADAERAAEEAAKAARATLDEAAAAAAARQAALGRLEAGGRGATRADWEAARVRREAAFDRLAAALEGPAEARAERFETARALTLAADGAAERLLFDVDRAARLQSARDELEKAQAEAETRKTALARAEEALRREGEATGTLWKSSAIAPGPAARMAAWRRAAAELLERRAKLETRRTELSALAERVEAARETLVRWLAEAGATCADAGAFEEAHRVARDRLKAMEGAWNAAREVEIARAQAAETLQRNGSDLAEAESALAQLRQDWPAAMAALGLRGAATPEEAEAALDAWASVGVPREKLRSAADRIEKIRAGLAVFEGEAAALVAAAAPDLAGLPALGAAARLAERLAAAAKAAAERDRLTAEGEKRAGRRAGIEAAGAARTEARAALRAALGADDDAELQAALERATRRAELETQVAQLRTDLADSGDGLDEAALRAEQGEFDAAALDAEIAEFEDEEERFLSDFKLAMEQQTEAKARLDALAAGRDAAGAASERAEAAGEIAETAERWLLRAAAAALARRAIERYRAAAQDPLIARAGELFAIATEGVYLGLGVGFDDRDQPALAARRASGSTVGVGGLSEGARDQLFLSLRLALLERRAGEPLPFIGDDLLASFDDRRAAQALAVLAEFGQKRQTILFTHHARIAELARGLTGRAVEVIAMEAG